MGEGIEATELHMQSGGPGGLAVVQPVEEGTEARELYMQSGEREWSAEQQQEEEGIEASQVGTHTIAGAQVTAA